MVLSLDLDRNGVPMLRHCCPFVSSVHYWELMGAYLHTCVVVPNAQEQSRKGYGEMMVLGSFLAFGPVSAECTGARR